MGVDHLLVLVSAESSSAVLLRGLPRVGAANRISGKLGLWIVLPALGGDPLGRRRYLAGNR